MSSFTNALGLDVGDARIGIARISSIAQLSEPLVVLPNDQNFDENLKKLISEHSVDLLVVGLPRNMSGEKTQQTQVVERFVADRIDQLGVRYVFQDETLSSVAADMRTPKNAKHMQDAYAACVILEDFIQVIN